MKYKALICDVDGTLIPNRLDGMPSQRITETIAKVKDKIHIGVATARPHFILEHIAEHLKLSGPSIVHGGGEIMNLTTGEIYFKYNIQQKDIEEMYKIAQSLYIPLLIDEEKTTVLASEENIHTDVPGSVAKGIDLAIADQFVQALSHIPTISVHKIPSWTPGKFDVSISHSEATKQNGILKVAEILGIETHEIIGVGDGYNDFPLLMACGLKVAMGNAVEDLKAIADYVAPSVEEDGVADVIEKFILISS